MLKIESFTENIVISIDNIPKIIKKEEIKDTNIELDKIFATCKIGYYESLMSRSNINTEGYQDLIVKMAIENQIDSKYTSFLAINQRDNKVYDIPQIEETPIEHSFDIHMDMVVDRFEPVRRMFEPPKEIFKTLSFKDAISFEDNMDILQKKLNQLVEKLLFKNIKKPRALIPEINEIIKTLDLNDVISKEIRRLVYLIKLTSESVYNQIFVGVEESFKNLFIFP